jgi:hypothetical protein
MAETPVRLTGGCQCGAVRYALASKPEAPGICHCRMCQKASGGPFMAFARAPEADVTWTRGTLSTFESSNTATRGFCSACGTPLTFKWRPDAISFTTGSFDEPTAIVPVESNGIEALLPWSEHIADLPKAETSPMPSNFVNHQHADHDT